MKRVDGEILAGAGKQGRSRGAAPQATGPVSRQPRVARGLAAAFALGIAALQGLSPAAAAPTAPFYLEGESVLLFRADPAKRQPAGEAQAIRVSRQAARNAVASGELPVELPDGTRYTLEVVREETSGSGDWTVFARTDTPLGKQSAVITFGRDGVYAVLPTPEGRLLQVTTRAGQAWLEAAGGMVPKGAKAHEAAAADFVMPPLPTRAKSGAASPRSASDPQAKAGPGGIEVDVLGIYSDDLVVAAGSVAAAETMFVNHIAVSNQALVDSGIAMTYRLVGLRQADLPEAATNHQVLDSVTFQEQVGGVAIHALRDSLGADLVAVLRPYRNGHGSCGVAYLNGGGLSPLYASADFGYSVSNIAPCGPYVLAHELGHNLGSHHDRVTARNMDGVQEYGAYHYSFGYRQDGPPAFATVMAYQANSQRWIGQFSRPGDLACEGVACGIADLTDNVLSHTRMAPRIARFRDPPGTITVLDATLAEGDAGQAELRFVVRLASPAPAGGVRFDIATGNGSATAGSDYQARALAGMVIPAGQATWEFAVNVFGDTQAEADETLVVALSNVVGATVFAGQATGTLRNDDPKATLSGRVRFAGGVATPTQAIDLSFQVDDGYGLDYRSVVATPPDFAYSLQVPRGVRVTASAPNPPAPLVARSFDWGRIDGDLTRDITLQRKPRITGRLLFPPGAARPTAPVSLLAQGIAGSPNYSYTVALFPPEFRYDIEVVPGADVTLELWSKVAPLLRADPLAVGIVESDVVRDFPVTVGVTVSGQVRFAPGVAVPNTAVQVWVETVGGYRTDTVNALPPDFRYAMAIPPGHTATLYTTAPPPVEFSSSLALGRLDAPVVRDIVLGASVQAWVEDVRISEGPAGTRMAEFRVALSQATTGSPTVYLETVDGTALAGHDYQATQQAMVFHPGQSSQVFSVPVTGNAATDGDRFFEVALSSPFVHVVKSRAFGVINDDDGAAPLALWVGDVHQREGHDGEARLLFPLVLSRPAPAGGVRIDASTVDGTALAGSDYQGVVGPGFIIPAGQSIGHFAVPVKGDLVFEQDESLSLRLDAVVGAVAARPQATALLVNDDDPRPPQAVDDHYALPVSGSLQVPAAIGVLANDRHFAPEMVKAYSLLGNPPRHGVLNLSQDGGLVYTPDPGYTGTDSFGYNACQWGACAAARVELSMVAPLNAGDRYVWMIPPAANSRQQGFVRLSNREGRAGNVTVWGIDATGRRSSGTLSLRLEPFESRQFNSQDAEAGNAAKGLTGALGTGTGNWVLVVRSALDMEALAYVRTPDGFLTSLHDRAAGDAIAWTVPMLNPAENADQASWLRLVNTALVPAVASIVGIDDAGRAGEAVVEARLAPLGSVELSASDLESGNAAKGLVGRLGDGTGKWRLQVLGSVPLTVQSLLQDPRGYLTNLSTEGEAAAPVSGERRLWMLPPASNTEQQGFIRMTNLEARSGQVTVWGIDDAGVRSPGTIAFTIPARASQQLNSQDLEHGNPAKGITGSLGDGQGNWRLVVLTDLRMATMGLVRTPDGFLTTIHDTVRESALAWRVPMLNPGLNTNQVSVLRVVNPNNAQAVVVIQGTDDAGHAAPMGQATLTIAANATVELTALELENGAVAKGLVGRLGAGSGKWVLELDATLPLQVMSLLRDPEGYLTNLSNGTEGSAATLQQ